MCPEIEVITDIEGNAVDQTIEAADSCQDSKLWRSLTKKELLEKLLEARQAEKALQEKQAQEIATLQARLQTLEAEKAQAGVVTNKSNTKKPASKPAITPANNKINIAYSGQDFDLLIIALIAAGKVKTCSVYNTLRDQFSFSKLGSSVILRTYIANNLSEYVIIDTQGKSPIFSLTDKGQILAQACQVNARKALPASILDQSIAL